MSGRQRLGYLWSPRRSGQRGNSGCGSCVCPWGLDILLDLLQRVLDRIEPLFDAGQAVGLAALGCFQDGDGSFDGGDNGPQVGFAG